MPGLVDHRARRRPHVVLAADRDRAGRLVAEPGERVDQLASGRCCRRPRCPTISPARTSNETPRTFSISRSSSTCRSSDLEERLARVRRALLDPEHDLAADHQLRQARLGRALARDGVDLLAAAEDADPVGDLEHLVQLVRDEDDRHPVGLEVAEDLEQLERLLRREHGGRLVEDQDVGLAVERLQDLDPLLLADRDVGDQRVGVDLELELRGELADALVRRRGSRA